MNFVNRVSDNFEETDIDFDKYQIIAVFDEVRSYGGYSIDIISVVENESNITVSIGNLQNGGDAPVITQPYHIVKIPISNKPIVFEDVYPKQIEFSLVGKGDNAYKITKSNIVIKDRDTWTRLINQVPNISYILEEVDIDFSIFQVIAVFDSAHSTGGYDVKITSIIESENSINVTIKYLGDGDDTTVIGQPYHIVKIPKSTKPIVFYICEICEI